MKKIILYIMPLLLILALFGYFLGTNLTLSGLLNESTKLNLQLPNINQLKEDFSHLEFSNIWNEVANAWEDVREIFSAIIAIGKTIYAIFLSVIEIGKMIYYTIVFVVEFITFIFTNFTEIGTMLYNYIFGK